MDKSKLIDKWFEQNHMLIFKNVEEYLKTGYGKGEFEQLLIELIQEFESGMHGQKPQSENGKLPIHVICSQSHVASGLTIGKKYEVIMQSKENDVVVVKNDYGELKMYSLKFYFS